MAKSYPYKSGKKQQPKNTSAKCKCGEIGRWKVTIQTSWFRGEDEVVWACDEHKDDVEYLYFTTDEEILAELNALLARHKLTLSYAIDDDGVHVARDGRNIFIGYFS